MGCHSMVQITRLNLAYSKTVEVLITYQFSEARCTASLAHLGSFFHKASFLPQTYAIIPRRTRILVVVRQNLNHGSALRLEESV